MSASLTALTEPAAYPEAAMARLSETGGRLRLEALRAEEYAPWLRKAADLAERSVPLLATLLAGTATEGESAGLLNAERLAQAGSRLCRELARRRARRAQIDAMLWARLHRRWYCDVRLVRREFAPLALLGLNTMTAQPVAAIRILPGALPALAVLEQDPWLFGADWDLPALAGDLTEWVL